MSQRQSTQSLASSGRYSKRKRAQINYYEESFGPEDVEPMTESQNAEQYSQSKKRKAITARPLPKRKIFPFLELPAEIRNMIYGYCLNDPEGIKLMPTTEKLRRTVVRETIQEDFYGREDSPENTGPAQLVPSLLAVSQQIYKEGRDILYGNNFVLHDTLTLHAFMVNIGPRAASLVENITIKEWGYGRGVHKAYNHACFATMISATNIKKLTIACGLSCNRDGKAVARQIYRDAFPWLEAVGAAKGKVDAAVDVIEIDEGNFGVRWDANGDRCTEDSMQLFREELGNLLGGHLKRVTTKPAKTSKKARSAS